MHLHFTVVELGEVNILENLSSEQRKELKISLLKSGLELLEDKKSILIEKIKNIVVEMVHYSDEAPLLNFSALPLLEGTPFNRMHCRCVKW